MKKSLITIEMYVIENMKKKDVILMNELSSKLNISDWASNHLTLFSLLQNGPHKNLYNNSIFLHILSGSRKGTLDVNFTYP